MVAVKKTDVIAALQSDILRMQGFQPACGVVPDLGLGEINASFPHHTFPLGAVHEFLTEKNKCTAASEGFIAGLLSSLMGKTGTCLWISSARMIFPPALKSFGIIPDRVIFVDLAREREILWAMDEALKCSALTAVIGEIRDLSFTDSRRLQLAVEQSKVTGFLLRSVSKINTTACVARWRVTSLPSEAIDDLPGIGFPKWKVELLRIRNGKPGTWNLSWANNRFNFHPDTTIAADSDDSSIIRQHKRTG